MRLCQQTVCKSIFIAILPLNMENFRLAEKHAQAFENV